MKIFDRQRALRVWETGVGYHLLFVLLLFMFVVIALASKFSWRAPLVQGFYLFVFFEALLAASRSHKQMLIGSILFAPIAFGWIFLGENSLLSIWSNNFATRTISSLFNSSFLFYLVALTVTRLFRNRSVTWSAVSAATSSFLMLGLAWTSAYAYIEQVQPGSFTGLSEDAEVKYNELFYFSFVTLTTLGYGDISPTQPIAQMVTVLEAIIGQLFLVILIARLVGMVDRRVEDPV